MNAVPTTGSLPAWAETVRQKYLAGEASTFVLHRNVFDSFLAGGQLLDLQQFLQDMLLKDTKPTVVRVSPEFGVTCLRGELNLAKDCELLLQLHSLEAHLRKSTGIAVLVPYADALLPGEDGGFAGPDERKLATLFHRWSSDRQLCASDNIMLLVVESLGSLNQLVLSSPKVAIVEVPMPGLEERKDVVRHLAPGLDAVQVQRYAEKMAGLRTVQIEGLMRAGTKSAMTESDREKVILRLLDGAENAEERAKGFAKITAGMTEPEIATLVAPGVKWHPETSVEDAVLQLIQARKRELIEKECDGLVEFVESKHGLDAVSGVEHIRLELADIAKRIREGDRSLCPMGVMAVGAMGAGKTFVLEAFLRDAGFAAVALKNVRSKWVGSTERNLERVLATIKAMGPVALVVDEADRSFGSRGDGEGGDDGTSSRVIARLKRFMSDPANRGVVLFVMLTNRPDLLDTDIKRPGRLDVKVPFFYPEKAADRARVVRSVLKRAGVLEAPAEEELVALCEGLDGYSNADLEEMVRLGVRFLDLKRHASLSECLTDARNDFMPPQQREMIEFMELLAVSETSRRSLLPERFRKMTVDDIQQKLEAARRRALGPLNF